MSFSKKKVQTRKRKAPKKSVQKAQAPLYNLKSNLIIIGLIAVFTFMVFTPALNNEYVDWDDFSSIVNNPYAQDLNWHNIKGAFSNTVLGGYIPITVVSYALENELLGGGAEVTHAINIVLHIFCVIGIYFVMLGFKLNPIAAAFVSILFAVHPMRVESVAWATERKDVLYGLFYIGGLFTYLKYVTIERKLNKYYWITILLFILSLFSKIQAVSFPLVLLLIDFLSKRKFNRTLWIEKIPFFVLSLLIGLMGIFLLSETNVIDSKEGSTLFGNLLIGNYALLMYLVKWLLPFETLAVYPISH